MEMQERVKLAPYTSFDIGGEARYFVEVSNEDELREALAFANSKQLKFFIISGGSNVLLPSDDFGGLVIRIIAESGQGYKIYKDNLIASAGAILMDIIEAAGLAGLVGLEDMYGIPGSVGGALRGNAGAFGTEMKDVVSKVRAINLQTGEVKDFSNKECEFEYRNSYFKAHPEWVILTIVFKLTAEGGSNELKQQREEILAKRGGKHNQDVKCAGSFFKNPLGTPEAIEMFEREKGVKARGGRVPAGWLIDKCELKGTAVGGAKCSEQQANYIINFNNATQRDVLELRDIIIKKVQDTFSTTLEPEVMVINA